MSSTNPDGTFSDTLDFTVRCEGQPLQPVPAEILFEIDTVDVTINVSNIP